MTKRAVLCSLLLIGAGAIPPPCASQSLMVAPPAVVIDARTRTGSLTLINDGNAPAEVSVSTFCGYPVTDSIGRMYLRTFAVVDDTMPCAAKWIESFPRRLRIDPKSRATVRLLATPPGGIQPREYWARVMVAARAGEVPVAGLPDSSGVTASLALEIRSVVGVFYRAGDLRTGVTLERLRSDIVGDSLVGRALLSRTGNAAFVGSLKLSLLDASGRRRSQAQLPLGVYYDLEPRFALALAGLPAGRYRLVAEAVGSRPDLPADLLLPTLPVQQTLEVALP